MSDLRVIETMRWEDGAIVRLDRHLARLARSCAKLGFGCDLAAVNAALTGFSGGPLRVRLTVGADGVPDVTVAPFVPNPAVWRVRISGDRLDPVDEWLRVKTTRRAVYDHARQALPEGVDEVLFANTQGALCEGTISNLFVDFGGGLLTPEAHCGLLPGVLREEMLETGQCREAVLVQGDLKFANWIFMGNSLRGLIPVVMV
jgi:4-amino-4-deoxychorismate lyase